MNRGRRANSAPATKVLRERRGGDAAADRQRPLERKLKTGGWAGAAGMRFSPDDRSLVPDPAQMVSLGQGFPGRTVTAIA